MKSIKEKQALEIVTQYMKWALTHKPSWETDNLIGDIIGWPKWYRGLHQQQVNKEMNGR